MMSIKMVDKIKRNHLYIKYLNIHLKTMSAPSSEWNTAYWCYLHLAKQQAGFIILQSIPGLLMTHHCVTLLTDVFHSRADMDEQ